MSEIIVAVVNETCRTDTWKAAVELALDRSSQLILYDIDSPAMLTDPLPSLDHERYRHPFNASELNHFGRPELARQVDAAREAGIEAWGWLPSSARPHALVDYLEEMGAATVVLPRLMTEQSWFQQLSGLTSAHIQKAARRLEVVLVGDKEGGSDGQPAGSEHHGS